MSYPAPSAVLELLKPVTWFAPMWAFMCGVISAGFLFSMESSWLTVLAGVLLAGPLVCGTSQAVNDWYDRDVDAINEPNRPVPSGRVPGRWGLHIAIIWTLISLAVAAVLGPVVLLAATFGLALAWMYSAPPVRLKQNGWWGNTAVALCYEGLPWLTGVAVVATVIPSWKVAAIALLYSIGAHGIMTLNDFKSIEGDRRMGIRTLPVQLGVAVSARVACMVMLTPQFIVIALLLMWGHSLQAAIITILMAAQVLLMLRLLTAPKQYAPWYNATGTTLYVLGMLVAAWALRGMTL